MMIIMDIEEAKTKLLMMTNPERVKFIDTMLDQEVGDSTLRFKMIELANATRQVKELKKEIDPFKTTLAETMKLATLGQFEITDGLSLNVRKGSRYYRISYNDVKVCYPHLLAEMEDIVKITETKDTITTKFIQE